jgi:hypothetical protein
VTKVTRETREILEKPVLQEQLVRPEPRATRASKVTKVRKVTKEILVKQEQLESKVSKV